MKHLKGQIAITLVCVLLGFIVMLQFRSVTKNTTLSGADIKRAETLQAELNKEREINASLSQQVLTYKNDLDKFREEAASSGNYAQILATQLRAAEVLAAMTDVEGPGIIVTLKDSQFRPSNSALIDQNLFVLHDSDILLVLNELRAAGAEALAINEERIIATSEVRCAGPTVSVNNTRYGAPFVIKAIGDPKNLESALTLRNGVVETLGEWGIEVEIVRTNKMKLSAYTGATSFKYATSVAYEPAP